MKKYIAIALGAFASIGVVSTIVLLTERNKRKKALQEKSPEELLELMNDAAILLELDERLDFDEVTRAKFDALKEKLRAE
ncbi:MAG: hypothetical protein ACK5KR_03225 [Breznakia sp.]